jgi:hypothetical protein
MSSSYWNASISNNDRVDSVEVAKGIEHHTHWPARLHDFAITTQKLV